jgi:O-antigen/teichoic acid export membrane protein
MFRRDSLYMVANSLQLLSGVLVVPFMTRVLGLHQYGVFASDLALLYLLYYTANLGLNIGIQRVYSQPDGEEKSRSVLAASLILVTLVTGAIYATGHLWSRGLGFGEFPASTRLTVIWSGLFAMSWICLAILRCHERLRIYVVVCVLQGVVGIGVGTIFAFHHNRTAADVVGCAVIVQIIVVLVSLLTVPPRWRGLADVSTIWTTLKFSLPIVPNQISTLVMAGADRIIVLRDLGPAATGRYQVAYTLSSLGIIMLTFLNLAWLPRIFSIRDPKIRAEVLAGSRDGLYKLLVPVTIGLALAGPLVLRLWVPRSFHPAGLIPVIVLVVASTIPVCTSFVHSQLILAEGRSPVVAVVSLTAAAINIVLNIILVPHMGINGSALVTLIAYFILAGGMVLMSRGMLRLRRPSTLTSIAVVASIAVVLLSRFIPINGAGSIVRWVGALIAGVIALRTLRELQMADQSSV